MQGRKKWKNKGKGIEMGRWGDRKKLENTC